MYTKHGLSKGEHYAIWKCMVARCHDPQSHNYPHYGGRGIQVCERWRNSVVAFVEDVGPRPSPKHQVDRINNDGDYEPGNVRWATAQEQVWNSRSVRMVSFDGRTLPIAEWAREIGISREAMRYRVNQCILKGAPLSIAVTTPAGELMNLPRKKRSSHIS